MKTYNLIILILACVYSLNCSNHEGYNNNNESNNDGIIEIDTPKIDVKKYYTKNKEIRIDSISLNSHKLFQSLYIQIVDSLKNNFISMVLYDVCLDNDNVFYCTENPHGYRSLRKSLIDSLSINDLEKILKLSNHDLLKKKCKETDIVLPYSKESNYDIITKKLYK